jgi:hypothetical protein
VYIYTCINMKLLLCKYGYITVFHDIPAVYTYKCVCVCVIFIVSTGHVTLLCIYSLQTRLHGLGLQMII